MFQTTNQQGISDRLSHIYPPYYLYQVMILTVRLAAIKGCKLQTTTDNDAVIRAGRVSPTPSAQSKACCSRQPKFSRRRSNLHSYRYMSSPHVLRQSTKYLLKKRPEAPLLSPSQTFLSPLFWMLVNACVSLYIESTSWKLGLRGIRGRAKRKFKNVVPMKIEVIMYIYIYICKCMSLYTYISISISISI